MIKLTLLATLIFGLGAVGVETNKVQPAEPDRTRVELCTEVEYEINLSVEAGLLTRNHGDQVIDRCFNHYAL